MFKILNEFLNISTVADKHIIEVLFSNSENRSTVLTKNFRSHFTTDENFVIRYECVEDHEELLTAEQELFMYSMTSGEIKSNCFNFGSN